MPICDLKPCLKCAATADIANESQCCCKYLGDKNSRRKDAPLIMVDDRADRVSIVDAVRQYAEEMGQVAA